VAIIGAPLDLGQTRRGVDMGPSAIRYAGLEVRLTEIGLTVSDRGNVIAPEPEALALSDERARYLPEILEACAEIAALVEASVREGARPLVLGGDHAVALGTLAGLAAAAGRAGGVIWIDAHADLNTPETSPSGNVHGMPLAAAIGRAPEWFAHERLFLPAVEPGRVALIGVRSLDPSERAYLRESGIRVFTMSDIDRIGIERTMREALDRVAGPGFVHVSLDLDSLDPKIAPGVGTPVRGGLTYREAHLACELVAESGIAGSFEVVEANPILDRENTTALTAVELVASALGKTIL
jgi:arginase